MIKGRGYIFCRPFLGERVPQHVQNIVIKDFCQKKNINFMLSATEYIFEDSTVILNQVMAELKNLDAVIFYSIFQLPKDDQIRKSIYKTIIKKKKTLFFACEGLKAENNFDFERIEKMWQVKKIEFETNKNLNEIKKFCK